MAKEGTISKQQRIELCADLLYAGKSRADIVQSFTKTYNVSPSAVDKWLKAARPIVEQRQKEANAVRMREDAILQAETAKRLNISRERVLEEYAKIAFFDIREIYNETGGLKPIKELSDEAAAALGGVETFAEKGAGEELGTTQKVKIWDKRAALDSICKVMGYNAPPRAPVDEIGETVEPQTVIMFGGVPIKLGK